MTYSVGIIGAGHGCRVHLPAIQAVEGLRVDALVQRSGRAIDGPVVFDSVQSLVANRSIDIAVLAVPPLYQMAVFNELAGKVGLILCEKPVGLSVQQVQTMLDVAHRTSTHVGVGFQFRYETGLKRLKDLIHSAALGSIERINIDWQIGGPQSRQRPWAWQFDKKSGGGVGLNFSTHVLDYVRWLLAEECETVFSSRKVVIAQRVNPNNSEDYAECDAEDSIDLFLKSSSGVDVSIRICNQLSHSFGHEIKVFGSQKSAVLSWRPPFGPEHTGLSVFDGISQNDLRLEEKIDEFEAVDSRILPTMRLWSDVKRWKDGECVSDVPTLEDALAVHRLLEQ